MTFLDIYKVSKITPKQIHAYQIGTLNKVTGEVREYHHPEPMRRFSKRSSLTFLRFNDETVKTIKKTLEFDSELKRIKEERAKLIESISIQIGE
jgi:hypothetical protein